MWYHALYTCACTRPRIQAQNICHNRAYVLHAPSESPYHIYTWWLCALCFICSVAKAFHVSRHTITLARALGALCALCDMRAKSHCLVNKCNVIVILFVLPRISLYSLAHRVVVIVIACGWCLSQFVILARSVYFYALFLLSFGGIVEGNPAHTGIINAHLQQLKRSVASISCSVCRWMNKCMRRARACVCVYVFIAKDSEKL